MRKTGLKTVSMKAKVTDEEEEHDVKCPGLTASFVD